MKFKFQDCMLVKVDRAKPGELVIKFSVKEEDYQMSDYIYLHALCKDGGTVDIEVGDAMAVNPVTDPVTGEVV